MKNEIILTKDEIAKVFLTPLKSLEDLNSFHCHISTLDNDSDISSTSLNLESEFLKEGTMTPQFEPVSPASKLAEIGKRKSQLVIYEEFDSQNRLKNAKSSQFSSLVEKLAELSKKYEKVEKIEENPETPEKITFDSVDEGTTESREKGIPEPEMEKSKQELLEEEEDEDEEEEEKEESKMPEVSGPKPGIKNSLTQIAIESRSKKGRFKDQPTQVVCAKCSII